MGQGAATAITPHGRRTPTGLPICNPATSPPSQPLCPASHYSTHHTGGGKMKKTQEGGETLNQESGGKEGNQEKCYTTRRPRHTNTASSTRQTQRRHMAGTCAEVTYCWTESAPMLTNNGKCYKANIVMRQPYRQSTSHQRTPKTLKTIAPSR